MRIEVVKDRMTKSDLVALAQETYGEMVKAVADLEKGWVAIGGDLHADAEVLLINSGSKQEDLWGFNLYPGKSGENQIEFTALINIRPRHGNPSITIEREEVRRTIRELVAQRIDWSR